MKTLTHTLIICAALSLAACKPSKKSSATPVANAPASNPSAPVAGPSSNGIFAPGDAELTAIQKQFPEATMQTLSEGHQLYIGACTNCHGAKSIYSRPTDRWPSIIEKMAAMAKFTDAQKDAVLKYVMSVKATQPG